MVVMRENRLRTLDIVLTQNTYRYAEQLWVHRHSEREGFWVLSVERLQRGHEGLTKLLWLEDYEIMERGKK